MGVTGHEMNLVAFKNGEQFLGIALLMVDLEHISSDRSEDLGVGRDDQRSGLGDIGQILLQPLDLLGRKILCVLPAGRAVVGRTVDVINDNVVNLADVE